MFRPICYISKGHTLKGIALKLGYITFCLRDYYKITCISIIWGMTVVLSSCLSWCVTSIAVFADVAYGCQEYLNCFCVCSLCAVRLVVIWMVTYKNISRYMRSHCSLCFALQCLHQETNFHDIWHKIYVIRYQSTVVLLLCYSQ